MTHSINYSKLVMSVGMIVFLAAVVIGGTGAFFSDTETSTGNVFTAGALDLKVDSVAHYNGLVCFNDVWHPESIVVWNDQVEPAQLELVANANVDAAIAEYQANFPAGNPTAGDECDGTWEETDLGPQTFFNFADLKPGDNGENTLSLHVYNNDAYACVIIDDLVDADNTQTEPELEDGDDTSDQGELSQELRFFAWADDGDNIWEPQQGEIELFSNTEGPASDVLDGVVYPLFTPETETVLVGSSTEYIGLYWCYGAISTDNNVLSCDGSEVTNLTQTDSLSASFTFYVEQARNNNGFTCPVIEREEPQWTDEGTRTGGSIAFVQDDQKGTVMQLTTIDDVDSRVRWSNFNFNIDLSSLTGISYDSKQVSAFDAVNGNASMRLFIDLDGDLNTGDVQEITYEPYYNIVAHNPNGPAAIVPNSWQTWPSALGYGKFWANGGFLGSTPSGGAYATNFTLQQVLDAHPSAKIVGISLGMGTYNKDQVVLVDDLLVNGSPVSLEN